jgi:hypothetical protein
MANPAKRLDEDNGLSPLTLEGQLRAAQQAAKQAQEKAKAQRIKLAQLESLGGRADNYGAGSASQRGRADNHPGTSILPIGIGELAGSSQKDNGGEQEDEDSGEEDGELTEPNVTEDDEQSDAVRLAYLKAEEQKRRALLENQEVTDETPENETGKGEAEQAYDLVKWFIKRKDIQFMVEAIPETFGLVLFPIFFIWVADHTLLVAKRKWPIGATIIFWAIFLLYVGAIFMVLVIAILVIDAFVYPLDALKNYGASLIQWIIDLI